MRPEDRGAFEHGAEDDSRNRFGYAGHGAVFHRGRRADGEGAPMHGGNVGGWFLRIINQADGRAPAVECLEVAEGVSPGHGGHRGFDVAGQDGAAGQVGFQRVGGDGHRDGDFFRRGSLAVDNHPAVVGGLPVANPRVGQGNAAGCAENARHVFLVDRDAGCDLGNDFAVELEDGGCPFIHAGLTEVTDALDVNWVRKILTHGRASDEAREGDRVAPDIEDAAAGGRVAEEAAGGVKAGLKAEGGLDHAHVTDGAGAEKFDKLGGLRMAPVHESFHEEDAVFAGGFDPGHGFRLIHAKRFFAQDMLAGGRGLDDPFNVEGVGCGDVDGLDRVVVEQSFVAAVGVRNAKFPGKFGGVLLVAAGDRSELAGGRFRDGRGEGARDGPGAENAPLNFIGHD